MHISTRITATSARVCSWLVPEHTRRRNIRVTARSKSTPLPEPPAVVRCFFSKAAAARFGIRTNSRDNLPFPAGVRATQLYLSDVHSQSGTLNMYLVLCLLRRWWASSFFGSCSSFSHHALFVRGWEKTSSLQTCVSCIREESFLEIRWSSLVAGCRSCGLSLPPGHRSSLCICWFFFAVPANAPVLRFPLGEKYSSSGLQRAIVHPVLCGDFFAASFESSVISHVLAVRPRR